MVYQRTYTSTRIILAESAKNADLVHLTEVGVDPYEYLGHVASEFYLGTKRLANLQYEVA